MGWSSELRKQFYTIVVQSYDEQSLKRMLKFELDKTLHELVKADSLENIMFDLMELAEQRGWADQLVVGAVCHQKTVRQLHEIGRKCAQHTLINLLHSSSLTQSDLMQLFKRSRPTAFANRHIPKAIDETIHFLWQMPHATIIEFVERTAYKLEEKEPESALYLRAWETTFAKLPHSPFEIEDIERVRESVRVSAEQDSYLLVDIQPAQSDPKRKFRVWMYDWRDGAEICCYAPDRSKPPIELADLPALLQNVIREEVQGQLRGIEFFLPESLLFSQDGLEQKKLISKTKRRSLPRRMATQYNIHARPRFRHEREARDFYPQWHGKWNQLSVAGQATLGEHVVWLHVCEDGIQLWRDVHGQAPQVDCFDSAETLFDTLLGDESVTCIGLTFTPDESVNELLADVTYYAILAGVPFMFWSRHHIDDVLPPADMHKKLHDLLQKSSEQFATHVHQRRRNPAETVCNQLTLLWDDPARVPQRLREL